MSTIYSLNPPNVQKYVAALQAIDNLTDNYVQLLKVHYHAIERTITAKQLAQAMGYNHYSKVNILYGRLAGIVGEKLNYNPGPVKLKTLITSEKRKGEWHWILRPEVATALELLGLIVDKREVDKNILYEKIFNELVYNKDVRSPPDNRRRAQFKIGWNNAILKQTPYTDKTLNETLTWNNLGYRFGVKLGHLSDAEIDEIYNFLAEQYLIANTTLPSANTTKLFPDELDSTEIFREGAMRQVQVNAYERDTKARQKCIEHYGWSCFACNYNFREVFGEIGQSFIHVHHLKPLSEIAEEYIVDPVKDLRPVCPNCHSMIHRRSPPFSIEEIKKLLNNDKHHD